MDRFSLLSDELLIKVLSFVPTKVAVSTSVLSKRWEHLWMWLPKLKFEYGEGYYSSSKCKRIQRFLDRNMPLHRAPVIDSLHLELRSRHFKPDSIKLWIVVAISHCLRELKIDCGFEMVKLDILPSNLYTCKSLVILKLEGDILLDVPQMVFLPSLKTLHLKNMRYFSEESIPQLLSNCPILEDLFLGLHDEYKIMGELTVIVPSLQSLSLDIPYPYEGVVVIKTPSLKNLKLVDHNLENHNYLIENMPNLIKAYIDVELLNLQSFFGSLTSVKHLVICSEAMYDEEFVFNQLQHLQICNGNTYSSDQIVRLLNSSPNLQVLDISRVDNHRHNRFLFNWNEPRTITKCMLSSLQTFNWDGYVGTPGERDLAVYILKNASHLRTATIKYDEWEAPGFEMRELTSRALKTCQLVFEPVLDY